MDQKQTKTKKSKPTKTDFLKRHKVFHTGMGTIFEKNYMPSEAIVKVKEYLAASELTSEAAINFLGFSISVAITNTISYVYNELMEEYHNDGPIANIFISNLAIVLWNATHAKFEFDLGASDHPDEQYLLSLTEHFEKVMKLTSLWYSIFFLVSSSRKLDEFLLYELTAPILKYMDASVEILVIAYFHALHDIAQMKIFTDKAVEGAARGTATIPKRDDEEIESLDNSLSHGGKIISFPNKTRH